MPEISLVASDSETEADEEVQPVDFKDFDANTRHPARFGTADSTGLKLFQLEPICGHPAFVRRVVKDAKKASALKAEGNASYKTGDFGAAILSYSEALEYVPESEDFNYSKAVYHCNRAACYLSMGRHEEVIKDCTAAIELDPRYVKAYNRRVQAYEAMDELESALADMTKIVEIDPTNFAAVAKRNKMEADVKEKQEKMKNEMIDKLKGLGNTVLGKFGLSLDNFKAVQDPNTGSYSISFEQ